MIRDAIDVLGERWLDRAADRLVGYLVGGPVRSVLLGTALLWAIGHWLGWWWVAAIAAAGIGDTAFGAVQLLLGGRR